FQAEDGIRDLIVTGVQTCALPIFFFRSSVILVADITISKRLADRALKIASKLIVTILVLRPICCATAVIKSMSKPAAWWVVLSRSEERRVGKECRYRRWEDD